MVSVGGHGSTLGAHLHLGHVFRLLHELDRLRQRICGGGEGTSEVRGRFEGGDGPPIGRFLAGRVRGTADDWLP